jgi:hypothetical protein
MDAKARYRIQLKLQAALGRVVEMLACLTERGIDMNADSLALATSVAEILEAAAERRGRAPEEFSKVAVALAAEARNRRRKETRARRQRAERHHGDLQLDDQKRT